MKLEVSTFRSDCSDKEQALKVLEEAAEVYGAWQNYDDLWCKLYGIPEDQRWYADSCLADEIADVITAACNLAERCGVDMQGALERCEQRNRQRGRYD